SRHFGPRELERVGDQIAEDDREGRGVAPDDAERTVYLEGGSGTIRLRPEHSEHGSGDQIQVDRFRLQLRDDARRIGSEGEDQRIQLLSPAEHEAQLSLAFGPQGVARPVFKDGIGPGTYGPERRAQVMARRLAKL